MPRWKGALPNIDVVYEPIEFVNRFLDDELLSSIVEETNSKQAIERDNAGDSELHWHGLYDERV